MILDFYPRPPRGGRQRCAVENRKRPYFYPRPPRGGRLDFGGSGRGRRVYFYPRPPRGGRPFYGYIEMVVFLFLTTPSAWRATFYHRPERINENISIHALREEGDVKGLAAYILKRYFYPRPPRGGRRQKLFYIASEEEISIHALREEGDASEEEESARPCNFYPRPPRGGRQLYRYRTSLSA